MFAGGNSIISDVLSGDNGAALTWAKGSPSASSSLWLLPAPFGPRNAHTCPRGTEKCDILSRGEIAVELAESFRFDHHVSRRFRRRGHGRKSRIILWLVYAGRTITVPV